LVELDWGYLGQRCPACGALLTIRETKTADGRAQFGLACTTHGRFTYWFLDSEDAHYGEAFKMRPKKSEAPRPKGTRPPTTEPIMVATPDTGANVVRDSTEAIDQREQRMHESAARKRGKGAL